MIFILISIIFNTYIGIIFKHFGQWKINTQVAIVVNYWFCVLTGTLFLQSNPFELSHLSAPWFAWSLVIGVLLISVFNVMSLSSVQIGVTLTQAANKMSLAIPVFFSFYLYHDALTLLKILGIILALAGVYFITTKSKTAAPQSMKLWWILPILFIGSGAIDTITKFVEINFIQTNHSLNVYLIHCFGAAALFGSTYLVFQLAMGKTKLNMRSILAGILLGVPNYFSIYFLVKALQFKGLESSSIIPINNIGILILVTLYGYLVFTERLSNRNKIGLGLALISILLLIFGN